jgi:hypothetical protein
MEWRGKENWGASRQDYNRLGMAALRLLENNGYSIQQKDSARPEASELHLDDELEVEDDE